MGDGVADDTAAIQAMVAAADALITAGVGHVVMQFDAKEYLLATAPSLPAVEGEPYAQIALPMRALTDPRAVLEYRGMAGSPLTGNENQPGAMAGGTILRSTAAPAGVGPTYGLPSVIGGPAAGATASTWTNVNVVMRGLTVRRPNNPSLAGVDLYWCKQAKVGDIVIDVNASLPSITYPTNFANVGLLLPTRSNNALVVAEGSMFIFGSYCAIIVGEHFTLNHLVAYKNRLVFALPRASHGSIMTRANCEWQNYCIADYSLTTGITDPAQLAYVEIGMFDIEDAPDGNTWAAVNHVRDPANLLGISGQHVRVKAGVGAQAGITKVGGASVKMRDLTISLTPTWTAATLENSWVSNGSPYAVAGYSKDADGVVRLRGLVKSGLANQAAFTLPEGSRPLHQRLFATLNHPSTACAIEILPNGQVRPSVTTTTGIALDGISFVAGS